MRLAAVVLACLLAGALANNTLQPSSSSSSSSVSEAQENDDLQCVEECITRTVVATPGTCDVCKSKMGSRYTEAEQSAGSESALNDKELFKAIESAEAQAFAIKLAQSATKLSPDKFASLMQELGSSSSGSQSAQAVAQAPSAAAPTAPSPARAPAFLEFMSHRMGMKQEIPGHPGKLWPAATIPYKFDTTNPVPPKAMIAFAKAMSQIQKGTCIRFSHDTRAPTAITLKKTPPGALTSCADAIGTLATSISLHPAQVDEVTCLHELGHVIGLMHTQQRMDALVSYKFATCGGGFTDTEHNAVWNGQNPLTGPAAQTALGTRFQYMPINWVKALWPAAYGAIADGTTGYNVNSIMHYPFWDANCMTVNGQPVPAADHWKKWTAYDSQTVNALYGCKKVKVTHNGKDHDQYVQPNQTLTILRDMVKDLTGLAIDKQVLKVNNVELTGDHKKLSELNVAENSNIVVTSK